MPIVPVKLIISQITTII